MKCENIEKLLSDYLCYSLDITLRDEVQKHLDECAHCSVYLQNMAKVDNLVKLKTKERPSKEYFENYRQNFQSKLDKRTVARRRRFYDFLIPRFTPAFSTVVIALLILMNGFLYMNIRQIRTMQTDIFEQQETTYREMGRYLTQLRQQVYN